MFKNTVKVNNKCQAMIRLLKQYCTAATTSYFMTFYFFK